MRQASAASNYRSSPRGAAATTKHLQYHNNYMADSASKDRYTSPVSQSRFQQERSHLDESFVSTPKQQQRPGTSEIYSHSSVKQRDNASFRSPSSNNYLYNAN